MQALIARLEAATEGSRELDAEIAFDCFAKPVGKKDDGGPSGYLWPENNASWSFGIRFPGRDRAWFAGCRKGYDETLLIERDGALVLMNSLRVLRYTTSIDAALTLVPEGWALHTLGADVDTWKVWLWCPANTGLGAPHRAKAKTGPLALCAAALRARAAGDVG